MRIDVVAALCVIDKLGVHGELVRPDDVGHGAAVDGHGDGDLLSRCADELLLGLDHEVHVLPMLLFIDEPRFSLLDLLLKQHVQLVDLQLGGLGS